MMTTFYHALRERSTIRKFSNGHHPIIGAKHNNTSKAFGNKVLAMVSLEENPNILALAHLLRLVFHRQFSRESLLQDGGT